MRTRPVNRYGIAVPRLEAGVTGAVRPVGAGTIRQNHELLAANLVMMYRVLGEKLC